jgi:hypothetical protein
MQIHHSQYFYILQSLFLVQYSITFAALLMRNTAFKYGSLMIGLLAALIIICSQSFAVKTSESAAKTETSAAKSSPEKNVPADFAVPTISATSFPAPAQINFFHEASCLFEVIFSTDINTSYSLDLDIPLSKFYSTILQVIISPNAP